MTERDPPFHSSTGYFIEFELELHALLEFVDMGAGSVEHEIARRKDELKYQMEMGARAERESLYEEDGYIFDPAALDDYYSDRIAAAETDFRPFVYMSGIGLLFTVFEVFLTKVAAEAATLAGSDERLGSRPPVVNRAVEFLRSTCGMVITLSEEDEQRLSDLRQVRNKLIHTLGSDIPIEVRARLSALLPEGDVTIDASLAEHAFEVVAGIAMLLEEAFAQRFGLDTST
jgi:hypothetical protein